MPRHALLNKPLRIPPTATTLNGFRQWMLTSSFPERGRISFFAGEIEVDMSPEDVLSHNDPKTALTVALGMLNEVDNLGRFQSDGARLLNEAAEVSNQPDLMFCRWESFASGRVSIRTNRRGKRSFSEVVGSPDLVVEILSRSSIRKDRRILPAKYFEAGITEYWLIDCRSEDAIDFQMLCRGPDSYVPVSADDEGFLASTALPYRFRLTRTRDPIGLWKYRLENRPMAALQ